MSLQVIRDQFKAATEAVDQDIQLFQKALKPLNANAILDIQQGKTPMAYFDGMAATAIEKYGKKTINRGNTAYINAGNELMALERKIAQRAELLKSINGFDRVALHNLLFEQAEIDASPGVALAADDLSDSSTGISIDEEAIPAVMNRGTVVAEPVVADTDIVDGVDEATEDKKNIAATNIQRIYRGHKVGSAAVVSDTDVVAETDGVDGAIAAAGVDPSEALKFALKRYANIRDIKPEHSWPQLHGLFKCVNVATGYSKTEKIDAVDALLEALDNDGKQLTVEQVAILKDGSLGDIISKFSEGHAISDKLNAILETPPLSLAL